MKLTKLSVAALLAISLFSSAAFADGKINVKGPATVKTDKDVTVEVKGKADVNAEEVNLKTGDLKITSDKVIVVEKKKPVVKPDFSKAKKQVFNHGPQETILPVQEVDIIKAYTEFALNYNQYALPYLKNYVDIASASKSSTKYGAVDFGLKMDDMNLYVGKLNLGNIYVKGYVTEKTMNEVKSDFATQLADKKTEYSVSLLELKSTIYSQNVELTGQEVSKHSVSAYNIVKFVGWKDDLEIDGVKYDCLANVDKRAKLLLDKKHEVYLAGVCLSYVGLNKGISQFRVSELDTTDSSGSMTLVVSKKTVDINDVATRLAYYNIEGQDLKGFRNGNAYRSGLPFGHGQKIIVKKGPSKIEIVKSVPLEIKKEKVVLEDEKKPLGFWENLLK